MDALLQPWVSALGAPPQVEQAGRDLLARYAEPHRRYHDRLHLAEVLQALTVVGGDAGPALPVLLAAYWHDAVYDPARGDNESRSADLAEATLQQLGSPPELVREVSRLVRLTAPHDPAPDDLAGAQLCDADLAILAAPPDRYAAYAGAVREEYAHLDDEAFTRGRAEVLRRLAERPRLFRTEQGRRRWEEPARRNLGRELAGSGPGPAAGLRP